MCESDFEALGITWIQRGVSGYATGSGRPDFHAVPPSVVKTGGYLSEIDNGVAFCNDRGINVLRVDTVSADAIDEPDKIPLQDGSYLPEQLLPIVSID